ncbi:MAG: UDP-N-acetylglucosamine 1-carboxyvinyltransferase, partial [Oscillospiraceae bacterium]
MQSFQIEGGNRLAGEIQIQGCKNSTLPLLAATILSKGETILTNCPRLSDVYSACRILTYLGCKCKFRDNIISVNAVTLNEFDVPENLMCEMRSSIIFLGAILGRHGECKISFPGGCELGPRPIDLHISALKKMGVKVKEEFGIMECKVENELHGAKIMLPFPSVGATENVMLAAVLAKGETEIINAAREPEILDLANFLNASGAKIFGAGKGNIVISGVENLTACQYEVMPDRIAAITYLSAAAITGGELNLTGLNPKDLEAVVPVFEEMGCYVYSYFNNIYISAKTALKPVKIIRTMPYPAFPTDAQAPVMAALTKARGPSVVVENI